MTSTETSSDTETSSYSTITSDSTAIDLSKTNGNEFTDTESSYSSSESTSSYISSPNYSARSPIPTPRKSKAYSYTTSFESYVASEENENDQTTINDSQLYQLYKSDFETAISSAHSPRRRKPSEISISRTSVPTTGYLYTEDFEAETEFFNEEELTDSSERGENIKDFEDLLEYSEATFADKFNEPEERQIEEYILNKLEMLERKVKKERRRETKPLAIPRRKKRSDFKLEGAEILLERLRKNSEQASKPAADRKQPIILKQSSLSVPSRLLAKVKLDHSITRLSKKLDSSLNEEEWEQMRTQNLRHNFVRSRTAIINEKLTEARILDEKPAWYRFAENLALLPSVMSDRKEVWKRLTKNQQFLADKLENKDWHLNKPKKLNEKVGKVNKSKKIANETKKRDWKIKINWPTPAEEWNEIDRSIKFFTNETEQIWQELSRSKRIIKNDLSVIN